MLKWVMAAALIVASPVVASAQDAEAGAAVFKKCAACHQVGADAKNALGPQLNCVVGRKAGSLEDYAAYSDAIKKSDVTWDEAALDQWVQGPSKMIKGTKMIFPAGVKDETDRANLIAYLKTQCTQ